MTCRDVREIADSFLSEELLTETNHEILRHVDSCPSCRAEIEARRAVRGALRTAFHRAEDLQPTVEFANRLRDQLRESAVRGRGSRTSSSRWLALAAGLVLAVAVTAAALFRSTTPEEAMARDAIGDHFNCALKFRLARMPVPLEEAAQRFDSAYRSLLDAPPDDIATPDGPARVIERHSCAYGERRFGHVILEYHGHVVSLLVTANEGATGAIPHAIGRPVDGLSVLSVNGSRHAIILVSDLGNTELTQLAGAVSVPLVPRLGSVSSDHGAPIAWLVPHPFMSVR